MELKQFNQVLRLIDGGDEKALKVIDDEFGFRIRWAAFLYIKDWHYTEDVLNEVLLKIWNRTKNSKDIESADAYIYEITKNAALDFHKVYLRKHENNNVADGETVLNYVPYIDHESEFRIMISSLDHIDQVIIIRKILYRCTHQEIATELEMPLGTVLWRYDKALDFLLKEYTEKENKD